MERPWNNLGFMRERVFADSPHRLCGATNDRHGARDLLFLHGVSRNWRTFHTLFPRLNETFRLSALDFRGHGGSARTPGKYLVVDYVDDAVTFMNSLDVRDAVLYGHSLGAMVALAAAARLPERIGALVLEDPPFSTMGPDLPQSPLGAYFRGMKSTVESSRDVNELAESFGNLRLNGLRLREVRDDASLRFAAEGFAMLDPAVLEPALTGRWLDGYDVERILSRVQCPVLLFQADSRLGGMLKDDEAALVASAVTNCQLVQVEGAPHLIHWEQPQKILDAMLAT